MKKKLFSLLLILIMILNITACGANVQSIDSNNQSSMFVIIESTSSWYVVYHKYTKVMYVVSYSSYNCGNFTLLVDEEGNPLLYEE